VSGQYCKAGLIIFNLQLQFETNFPHVFYVLAYNSLVSLWSDPIIKMNGISRKGPKQWELMI